MTPQRQVQKKSLFKFNNHVDASESELAVLLFIDAKPIFIFCENFRVAKTLPMAFLIFGISFDFFSNGCIKQA